MSALSSVASDDVWAGGMRISDGYAGHPLVEHWDRSALESLVHRGRVRWYRGCARVVTAERLGCGLASRFVRGFTQPRAPPGPALGRASLAARPRDWSYRSLLYCARRREGRQHLGYSGRTTGPLRVRALDGRRWTFVLGPRGGASRFFDLAVFAPDNVVAVGGRNGYRRDGGLVLRWDGKRWAQEPSPSVYVWNIVDAVAGETWAIGVDGNNHSVIARCRVSAIGLDTTLR
jgi:hypothetical protein